MEDGALVREFLGDMPVVRFVALYIFALAGMILFYSADIAKAVKTDPKTPNKFSWRRLFTKGLPRIVGNLIVLAIIVIFYGKLSVLFFNAEAPLALDGFSAVIMGAQSDMLVNKIVGLARKNSK